MNYILQAITNNIEEKQNENISYHFLRYNFVVVIVD